jgi:predicted Ser/Thr protein kinase
MGIIDYKELLGYHRQENMRFSEFVEHFIKDPIPYLHTSATLIYEAIKYFGYKIVVRSGEPTIRYNLFDDPFSGGINAVYGQEFCITQLVEVIESIGKESGPNRGIVMVGPPASGKTNIVDLIGMAIEVYTKQENVKLYTFYYQFKDKDGRALEIRSAFLHNPILLFPVILKRRDNITHPRQELFDYINSKRRGDEKIIIPTYFQNANLDKQNLDIIKLLLENPNHAGKSLFDIIEEYVRIEKIEFSSAQAKGIANIDDMSQLAVRVHPIDLGPEYRALLNEHLPGYSPYIYEGAIVSANRGLLHIHDAFGINEGSAPKEQDYKPLLMLLGSGKSAIQSTQASIDTTVILTTNIEEMKILDKQITSSKFLDRIDKIPVNYLLDANSEMDILKRDIFNMRKKLDIDPNLLRIAAYYSVMTRLLPPMKSEFQDSWSKEKRDLYLSITPEQKLFIYAAQPDDPVSTIQRLTYWHPFYNEAIKLDINIYSPQTYKNLICKNDEAIKLDKTGLFTPDQLKLIDDEFMREMWNEYNVNEGKHGISVRQLQNIMRNTIAKSDGRSVNVGIFFSQLNKLFREGLSIHQWLPIDPKYKEKRKPIKARKIGEWSLSEDEGDYGDFFGLTKVAKYLYYIIISREITVATVDRDPDEIAQDLRKYIQHALLANALDNRAFSHILVPRYTFVDPSTGNKIDKPDFNYLRSLEKVFVGERDGRVFRQEVAQRFLDLTASGELKLEKGKAVINSRYDNLLTSFAREYSCLLSHRKSVEGISIEQLRDAFFQKKNTPEKYKKYSQEIDRLVETILNNMVQRFLYSYPMALNTVVYALRKRVVDFSIIIC